METQVEDGSGTLLNDDNAIQLQLPSNINQIISEEEQHTYDDEKKKN